MHDKIRSLTNRNYQQTNKQAKRNPRVEKYNDWTELFTWTSKTDLICRKKNQWPQRQNIGNYPGRGAKRKNNEKA